MRDLTHLIGAIDNFIRYKHDNDPAHVAAIALNGVSSVDSQIGGHDETYSIENRLGSPAMVAERERVQRLLLPSPE